MFKRSFGMMTKLPDGRYAVEIAPGCSDHYRSNRQGGEIDPILGKALGVLGHAELFEPVRNLLHCGALSHARATYPIEEF
jgi:hypothetical protein